VEVVQFERPPAFVAVVAVEALPIRFPVMFPEALIVVNEPDAGVVPPIGPGLGKDTVVPPRATDVPPIVMAEFAKPAFARVPVKPNCTLPTVGLVKVKVKPFVAALFSKLTVAVEMSGAPFTWIAPVPLEHVPLNSRNPDVQEAHKATTSA